MFGYTSQAWPHYHIAMLLFELVQLKAHILNIFFKSLHQYNQLLDSPHLLL